MSVMNYPMMGTASLYDGYPRGFGSGMYGAHIHDGMFGSGYGRGFGGFGDYGYGNQLYGGMPYGHGAFGVGNMEGYGYPYGSMASMYYDNPYGGRRHGYGYNSYGRGSLLRRSHSLGSMRRFY